jgi:DNA replication protein DnaC
MPAETPPPPDYRDVRLLRSATFEGIDPARVDGMEKALRAAARWVTTASKTGVRGDGAPKTGLVLRGDTGTGKTHLMTASARRLAALLPQLEHPEYRILVVGEAQLHAYTRACWAKGEPMPERLRNAIAGKNRSWLFLDDLGTGAADVRFAEEMADILLLRHGSDFPTLTMITTNLDMKQIEDCYGSRLASRLKEMVLSYTLTGDDQRRPDV